jgi:hypothetical protein
VAAQLGAYFVFVQRVRASSGLICYTRYAVDRLVTSATQFFEWFQGSTSTQLSCPHHVNHVTPSFVKEERRG